VEEGVAMLLACRVAGMARIRPINLLGTDPRWFWGIGDFKSRLKRSLSCGWQLGGMHFFRHEMFHDLRRCIIPLKFPQILFRFEGGDFLILFV
jgi:hypothetical protein